MQTPGGRVVVSLQDKFFSVRTLKKNASLSVHCAQMDKLHGCICTLSHTPPGKKNKSCLPPPHWRKGALQKTFRKKNRRRRKVAAELSSLSLGKNIKLGCPPDNVPPPAPPHPKHPPPHPRVLGDELFFLWLSGVYREGSRRAEGEKKNCWWSDWSRSRRSSLTSPCLRTRKENERGWAGEIMHQSFHSPLLP